MLNYGPSQDPLANNGGCFTLKIFHDVCQIMNIHKSYTTKYQPLANCQVGRFKRTVKSIVRAYLADHPRDQNQYIDELTFANNCKPHAPTMVAPSELKPLRPPPTICLRTQSTLRRSPENHIQAERSGSRIRSTAPKNAERNKWPLQTEI